MPSSPPRRIRVVGISGSGKTRLAAEAAAQLDLPHLELDEVFWDADWTFRDLAAAHALIDSFLSTHPDGWVADGNWTTRLEGRMTPPDGCDALVWLDHPRWLVMARVVRRTLWRGFSRQELWHGNRERPANWLSRDPDLNIMVWAWTQYDGLRERMLPLVGSPGFVRLRGRAEVRRWLASLAPR